MFDLIQDPDEMNNVYNQTEYIEIQNSLKDKLLYLQEMYGDRGLEYTDLQEVMKNYWK
jgi:hypothetical protein